MNIPVDSRKTLRFHEISRNSEVKLRETLRNARDVRNDIQAVLSTKYFAFEQLLLLDDYAQLLLMIFFVAVEEIRHYCSVPAAQHWGINSSAATRSFLSRVDYGPAGKELFADIFTEFNQNCGKSQVIAEAQ